jgi:PilZ domain
MISFYMSVLLDQIQSEF